MTDKKTLDDFGARHNPLSKERAAHSMTKDLLKQAQSDAAILRKEVQRFQFAMNAGLAPADWTLSERGGKKADHIPLLLVSDAQVGEVIQAAETEYGRGYDTPIYRERYRELIDTTIYLADQHVSKDWQYPGMIYVRAGDAISGGIHDELRETDDLTPLEAVRVVFEEECAGIEKLVEFFGRVDVKSTSGGNHDRTTLKPQSKLRVEHSHDALIDYMLANYFRKDERVTFQLTKSPDVVFPVGGKTLLATHGDNIGSGGGTGFIGPVANIAKGVQKIIMEQVHMGRIIDHVLLGHFHTFHHCHAFTENGSFPGYSEFAKKFRMRPEPPTQVLQFWNAKHGLVDLRTIRLA